MTDPIPGLDRRQFLRAATATGALASTGVAAASHDDEDGNPLAGFGGTACDVDRTDDRYLPWDSGGAYGGWGGHEYHATKPGLAGGENPVVFVHGNTHDGCDWSDHATRFLDRGYRGDQLWSITFAASSPTHDEMARQLEDFVSNVLEHTGADTIDVVSHSLGVTGVRVWMADSAIFEGVDDRLDVGIGPRYDAVDTFVGCAGANEGTYTCGPGCERGVGSARPCAVISPDCTQPGGTLHALNTPDETPGDVDYYTIRGNLDYFYTNQDSPKLDGANANVLLSGRAHNATRASDTAVEFIYQWVTGSDSGRGDRETDVDVSGSRTMGGTVYVQGGTGYVQLSVDADRPVLLRDRVPYTADVLIEHSDDVVAVAPRPHRGVREVYLGGHPAKSNEVEYLVSMPESSGNYDFGPAQVRTPDATEWADVADTSTTVLVLGGEI